MSDINGALKSRNFEFNRKYMINKKKIKSIDHYIWWFSNKRESFVASINSKIKIYFWHQIIKYQKEKYCIGGWHSNSINLNMLEVLYVLKWQLKYLMRNKKNYTWIAVTKKNNKAILSLTRLLGYKTVSIKESKFNKIINITFKVKRDKYRFLKLANA
tara:strand:- start:133 stop:606 length:474 start_codon:yes stop_codon:yes gene_type:complete